MPETVWRQKVGGVGDHGRPAPGRTPWIIIGRQDFPTAVVETVDGEAAWRGHHGEHSLSSVASCPTGGTPISQTVPPVGQWSLFFFFS